MKDMSKRDVDLLQALQDSIDRAKIRNRVFDYKIAVARGDELFGGHLGTCDALAGYPYCNCGKEDL